MVPRVRRFAAHPFGGAAIHWIAALIRLTPALLGSGRARPRGRPGPTAEFAPSLARTLRAVPPSTALLGGVYGRVVPSNDK